MQKNPRLEWREEACADLLAIVDHISDDNPQAAQDLKDEIEAKVNDLPSFPKKHVQSRRAAGYRQLTVRDNYLVFYRLLSEKVPQIIDVAAVVHARRKWP
ncbi:MAG: hypothetical protein AUK53_01410 [Betaproteobacteria bacterium CG2_30_59_46]|nr:MAG: hypothetical protein AUK53_01410 [Betaproteobacteria bacterium CG2_30_59_46]PIQ13696.1 MAG: type II toxin-antitoxin system mRNA interferase toxin, RelE/StbE family [Hydrogenophilales bacterium CG18_big_fil_WC_8_21_14_2_50_58_12]PIX99426.1 MAG: type II toxin-antitoxin system mRNA interferase toxin, RelE/StbE family [Hydrogenophilales bacterium CG_4_10_14_3_um_filter_58_23]PJB05859.1 MAG: type II toxin-antitoxin system mRNA interferase toxin, RelE/StbE family [Hydrogenophilales bacterium C